MIKVLLQYGLKEEDIDWFDGESFEEPKAMWHFLTL